MEKIFVICIKKAIWTNVGAPSEHLEADDEMFDQRYDMEGNYQVTRGQVAPDGYVEIDPDDLERYEGYSEDGEDGLDDGAPLEEMRAWESGGRSSGKQWPIDIEWYRCMQLYAV